MTCRQALKLSSIDDTYFLVQWKDEGSHSISTRELQEHSSAPYLKEGSDIEVKVLEKKTKKIHSAVVLASVSSAVPVTIESTPLPSFVLVSSAVPGTTESTPVPSFTLLSSAVSAISTPTPSFTPLSSAFSATSTPTPSFTPLSSAFSATSTPTPSFIPLSSAVSATSTPPQSFVQLSSAVSATSESTTQPSLVQSSQLPAFVPSLPSYSGFFPSRFASGTGHHSHLSFLPYEDDRSTWSRSSTPQSSLYFGDSEVDYKLEYKLEDRLEQLKCNLFGKFGEMQQQFETLRKEIVGRKRSKKVMQNDNSCATNEQGESFAPMCSVSTFASTASASTSASTSASVQSSHDTTCGEEGVWLGDPASNIQEGRKIWIPGVSPINILQAEAVSPSPKKLVLNLMSAIFTTQELATSNCTQPRTGGVKLLDQKKIHGIRLHIRYKYPVSPDEEAKRWTNLLQNQMNGKCSTLRDAALRKVKTEQV